MGIERFIAGIYRRLEPRRRWLFAATLVLLLGSFLAAGRLHLEENIATMLPDGHDGVTQDFQLLQEAPFARKVVISVRIAAGGDPAQLTAAADRLSAALDPALFTKVSSGPDRRLQLRLLPWLLEALPDLLTAEDLRQLQAQLRGDGARKALEQSYEELLGPEGWALKGMIRRDPLGLRRLALTKLRYLNLVPGVRLVDNHFVSADGRSALLLAETPVAITDSAGAAALEAAFGKAEAALPTGVTATMVSAHRYTLANARAIQGDLWRILGCSGIALLLIFVAMLRSLRAVYVFLIPVAVLAVSAVAVALFYSKVSAITLGFGGVLLGITVDFGLHVYYALRYGRGEAGAIVGKVARPVLFGALTTIAAFAVLLGSDLPGQRQLAVFSITGLTAALVLALVVLPHLLPVGNRPPQASRAALTVRSRPLRLLVLGLWLVFCAWSAWQARNVRIDGDLNRLSLVPPALARAEKELAERWGGFRNQAMIWTAAGDENAALTASWRAFTALGQAGVPVVSLAPLLPPREVQAANRVRWNDFWNGAEGRRALAELDHNGAALGFAANAFQPFRDALKAPAAPLSLDGLRQAGLGDLVEALAVPTAGGVRLLTLAPDTPEVATALSGLGKEVRLVSPTRFRQEISAAIGADFMRFLTGAALLSGALLVLLFRRPGKILAAALPVATGLLAMFGIMGALGIAFNLFNVIATILVIGLGMDYGIFMVCRYSEGQDLATGRAVLASGLTTLAGFGALVLGRHPALHSIGVTVLLGIGIAIPAALLVIPVLYARREG